MLHYLTQQWLFVTAAIDFIVAIVTSAHVVLTKRDTRATIAWVGLIWLTPLIGAALYIWLRINRIERRARALRSGRQCPGRRKNRNACSETVLDSTFQSEGAHLRSLVTLVNGITRRPLLRGNKITPLIDGDEAFPEMIRAIDDAIASITLGTYIFDNEAVRNTERY